MRCSRIVFSDGLEY